MIDWGKVKPAESPDFGAIKPRCRFHESDAVCNKCPERYSTDGLGFPHPKAVPNGVRRLQVCTTCKTAVDREHWNNIDWKCTTCKPIPDETRRKRIAENVRKAYRMTAEEAFVCADEVMQPGLQSLTEKEYPNGAQLPQWTSRTNEEEQAKRRRELMKQRRQKHDRK